MDALANAFADLQQWLWGRHKVMTVAIIHPEFHGLRVTPSVYTTLDEVDLFPAEALRLDPPP